MLLYWLLLPCEFENNAAMSAATVEWFSGNIIVTFAISGCLTKRVPIIAIIVDFAGWEDGNISNIVMIAVCALMPSYLMIITAKLENTCQIALSAKKTCFHRDMPVMRCPVGMPFTGIVSRN